MTGRTVLRWGAVGSAWVAALACAGLDGPQGVEPHADAAHGPLDARWIDLDEVDGRQVRYIDCGMESPAGWLYDAASRTVVRAGLIDQEYVDAAVTATAEGWRVTARSLDSEGNPSTTSSIIEVRSIDAARGLATWSGVLTVAAQHASAFPVVRAKRADCE